jgi:prolyl-tRNA synthetase
MPLWTGERWKEGVRKVIEQLHRNARIRWDAAGAPIEVHWMPIRHLTDEESAEQ